MVKQRELRIGDADHLRDELKHFDLAGCRLGLLEHLLGLGLRQLSLTPHNIPEVKKLIRSVTITQAESIAHEVLRMETARDVNNYLREQTKRLFPRYDEVRGGD